jgi:hypothetical protein
MKTVALRAIGIILRVIIKKSDGNAENISSATKKEIHLKSPTGKLLEFPAEFVTDGEDGGLQYITASSADLNEVGTYCVRCYIEMTGYSGLTLETEGFIVK